MSSYEESQGSKKICNFCIERVYNVVNFSKDLDLILNVALTVKSIEIIKTLAAFKLPVLGSLLFYVPVCKVLVPGVSAFGISVLGAPYQFLILWKESRFI